ncbi:MAG TPA: tetratricopeptide repeat protein [Pirellulales bacterium]|nr:tetratricopeptide repeat protein [Pirellulales bacterium]
MRNSPSTHCTRLKAISHRRLSPIIILLLASVAAKGHADDQPAAEATASLPNSVEKLFARVRPSVVVITFAGRDRQREGLGTGFIVSRDGLIATNLHVIGEARPIAVETADGKHYEVTAVEASDRADDLALVRIDARDLPPLELGDSDTLKQGQPIVAVGNPHGLTHSVVSGIVSGQREIDGRQMIQLAIPIEPGNSGGPLLDLEGRVYGLLTMKSQVTPNLGFAVAVNRLKPLIEKPNPIPMSRWLAMGAPDPKQWQPLLGGRWRQKAGKLIADGPGQGFGGRTLCLSQQVVPEIPYELAVSVRLDDESGAAGLVFSSDGGNRHFGFYPSAGKLRLTQFDGPDVTTWQVLEERPSPDYLPGDWNTLKVRVDRDKVVCYVNGHVVIESTRAQPNPGRVGLAKFRDTRAEFKGFVLSKEIPTTKLDDAVVDRVDEVLAGFSAAGELDSTLIEQLAPQGDAAVAVLRERAKQLDREAGRVRQIAAAVYAQQVLAALARELDRGESESDLLHAALLLARLDNDELDVAAYRQHFENLAEELKGRLPPDAAAADKLKALDDYLFTECGFHGSRGDYYNRRNSYVNEVLDDREGIPITLSLVYMELARRLGLNVVGIGLPGHFVVGWQPAEGEQQLIDVFERGERLTREQAQSRVLGTTGQPLDDEHLKPVEKRAMLVRMLRNLQSLAGRNRDLPALLRYLDAILTITPDSAEDRMYRAFYRYQTGQGRLALEDIDWLLSHDPPGIDLERVAQLRDAILTRGK